MKNHQRISVALATYCGEKFLDEQLRSLVEQTILPDELIISDDGSTDRTLEIVQHFQKNAPFRVIVIEGGRLGFNRNFERALAGCSGDIVLFCDQDDYWLSSHIHELTLPFTSDPDLKVVVSNSYYADVNLRLTGATLWSSERFDVTSMASRDPLKRFKTYSRHRALAGHGMAFRRSLQEIILPFGKTWVYDQWVGLVGVACGSIALIAEPQTIHRQHGHQSVAARAQSLMDHAIADRTLPPAYFDNQIEMWMELLNRLDSQGAHLISQKVLRIVESRIELMRSRRALRDGGSGKRLGLATALLISGAYHRDARGLLTYARDVLG